MPFDGNGNYVPPAPPTFPAVDGTIIRSDYFNTIINDVATALSLSLTKDGQSRPTAEIDFNGENLTNVDALDATSIDALNYFINGENLTAAILALPASPEDYGGVTATDIVDAATASLEVRLAMGGSYSLTQTVDISALNNRIIYLNGATVTGAGGFVGDQLFKISGDSQIIGPGILNGANVAAPAGAYVSGAYAGVGVYITGTGDAGQINGVAFTNFQSGPILHDSTTSRENFKVIGCIFEDVQKYVANETNGVVHLHGVSYPLMENNLLKTYNWKGYYTANSASAKMFNCISIGGNSGHASHYITGGNDCEIADCSHTGAGFGIKGFKTPRITISNFSCPSAHSAVYLQGCLDFTIDGVKSDSPSIGVVYIEGVAGFPTKGLVNNVRSTRAAPGTTADHVGVYISGSGTGTVLGVKVSKCYFENMLFAARVANSGIAQTDIEIVNNEFRNTGQYGVLGYIGSGRISGNLIEMDAAAVEAAIHIERDGVTTTGTVVIEDNIFRGCTADNIELETRLHHKSIRVINNTSDGGTVFLNFNCNGNAADTVNMLEVSGNQGVGLTSGCLLTFNTTTLTGVKVDNNTFVNGSFAPVGNTITNPTNATNFAPTQRGTITLAAGTATVAFSIKEPDTNYLVQISGNANETFYWSAKATGGFTITSSNAASTAVVNWIIGR